MNSTVVFKIKGENNYAYDTKGKTLLYLHPLLSEIIQYTNDSSRNELCKSNKIDVDLIGMDLYDYYYQKYLFLKQHGYFSEIESNKLLSGAISLEMIHQNLSNLNQIVFQVTSDCNLRCMYCCFGDLYNGPTVEKKYMDFRTVQSLFLYLIPFWRQNGASYKNSINIGFYGGEPLLNIALIKKVVAYCEEIHTNEGFVFEYSMTTNATYIPKHIDYLVKHDFNLLISLDGNESHDSYRVDKDGKQTFEKVFDNVKYIQNNYNDYFEKKVYFNSVLTDKSTVEEIHNFIFENFHKSPLIDPVSTTDLNDSRIGEYEKINQIYNENTALVKTRKEYSIISKEISRFFYYNLNNSYHYYGDLLFSSPNLIYKKIPTGTCLPFWKKMYITSTGDIMVCEKIAMTHVWGKITNNNVFIDFDKIVTKYNLYLDNIRSRCQNCYRFDTCPVCLFQLKIKEYTPQCPYAISEDAFKEYLSGIVAVMESDHDLFFYFNNEIFS